MIFAPSLFFDTKLAKPKGWGYFAILTPEEATQRSLYFCFSIILV